MHERISVHQICLMGMSNEVFVQSCGALGARRVSLVSQPQLFDGLSATKTALDAEELKAEAMTHVFLPGVPLCRDEVAWQEARAQLSCAISAAAELGMRSIYMLTGGHGGLPWEEAAQNFSEAVAPSVGEAKKAGVELLIECAPFLYAETHIAHNLRDTLLVAEMAGIGVNIDIFSCWFESELRDLLRRAMPRCHLIQVSDYVCGDRSLPARAVPGDGAIPLQRILAWALEAGYDGAFELELLGPRIDKEGPLDAVRRAGDSVGAMLQSLGA